MPGVPTGGGETILGIRLRNGIRNCGISLLLVDNRRLFRDCSCPVMVAVRTRFDLRVPGIPASAEGEGRGRSGVSSPSGLLDLDNL